MQEVYKVVGYNFGRFTDNRGKEVVFCQSVRGVWEMRTVAYA